MMGSFNAIILDEINSISKDMRKLLKVDTYLHSITYKLLHIYITLH